MASRTTTATRPRSGSGSRAVAGKSGPATKRAPAQRSAAKRAPAKRPPAKRPPQRQGPGLVARTGHAIAILVRALFRAVKGLLGLAATAVGGDTRAANGGAK